MKTATEPRRPTHSHRLTNAFSVVYGKLGTNWGLTPFFHSDTEPSALILEIKI